MANIEHKNITGIDALHPFAYIGTSDPGAIGADKGWIDTNTSPPILKYRNSANTAWVAYEGEPGATGAAGANGTNGTNGTNGADGVGVPIGGTTGQVLAKNSGTDYDTEWVDQTGGGGGGSGTLDTFTHTTGSIADAATANETLLAFGKTYIIHEITVDRACRVRFYRSDAFRTADASRAVGTLPTDEHGVVLDISFAAAGTWVLTPMPLGSNAEAVRVSTLSIAVTNDSGSTGTVTIDLAALILET